MHAISKYASTIQLNMIISCYKLPDYQGFFFRSSLPANSGIVQWTQHNSEPGWPLQIHTREGGEDREAIAHRRDNPVLPCILPDVKLLRLGCISSACGLRRVPALLVFYSSFGSQNTVQCKSLCIKIPPIVSKLKGEKYSQLHYICSDRLFADLLPLALSIFPSPLSVT
jgi:hypothetical protein